MARGITFFFNEPQRYREHREEKNESGKKLTS